MADRQHIFVINSGSSSVKYQLLSLPDEHILADGSIEGIGGAQGRHHYRGQDGKQDYELKISDHHQAFLEITKVLGAVLAEAQKGELTAIGHRVVHGGERFIGPTRIDQEVLAAIEQLSELAPLHNPANAEGIRVALAMFPEIPQVAVFDTAFHQTMPPKAYRYAVPEQWYRNFGIRRYGFHGTSHRYVAQKAAEFLQRPLSTLNLITLHLGNGASACAIANGMCVDTSMGFTPLEGLVMGTRSGDIDPSVPLFLQQHQGLDAARVGHDLNHQAGLQGLAGTNDMKTLLERVEQGDQTAELAVQIYAYRIKKYIGAYCAALGKVDAVVFTGGIGENAAEIRRLCCENLETVGIHFDVQANQQPIDTVSSIGQTNSPVNLLVIPTDEALQIAIETLNVIEDAGVSG